MPEQPTIATDPNALMQGAKCYSCIPDGMKLDVLIYLFAQGIEAELTVGQLIEGAKCYQCIPRGMQLPILIYLLAQLQSEANVEACVAPVLTAAEGGAFSWTYSGDTPTTWQFYTSNDGGATWTSGATAQGSITGIVYPVGAGSLNRIIGLDASTLPMTPFSNTVSAVGG